MKILSNTLLAVFGTVAYIAISMVAISWFVLPLIGGYMVINWLIG